VPAFLDYLYDLSVCNKHDIFKGFEENEEIMNQLDKGVLSSFAVKFYDTLSQIQQNGYNKIQGQRNASPTQYSIIQKCRSRAFHWMKKAANMGKPEAMFQLGAMYCSGHGVKKDSEQGEIWFDEAISTGSDFTERIARLFHVSKDMRDLTLVLKYYKRLETVSSREYLRLIILGLGLLYEYGDGVEQDYQKTLGYYTRLMDNDQDVARLRLGLMYYYGKGVAVDYRKSFDLFQKTKNAYIGTNEMLPYVYSPNDLCGDDSQGDLVYCLVYEEEIPGEAHYYLGLHYKYEQGVPYDQGKAQHHFREASNWGCKRAECEIADQHF
jgi:TPR repeat protein